MAVGMTGTIKARSDVIGRHRAPQSFRGSGRPRRAVETKGRAICRCFVLPAPISCAILLPPGALTSGLLTLRNRPQSAYGMVAQFCRPARSK